MKHVLTIVFAIFLAACASSGNKINQANIEKIEVGSTTFDQMVSMFGAPAGQGYGSEGKLTANWIYVYVGPFGTGMEQQILSVMFDDDKKVEKFNMTDQAPGGVKLGR